MQRSSNLMRESKNCDFNKSTSLPGHGEVGKTIEFSHRCVLVFRVCFMRHRPPNSSLVLAASLTLSIQRQHP